jgi:hypothetical protein
MSDKLARRVEKEAMSTVRVGQQKDIPGIIIFRQPISVSCTLNHHDMSTGVFRGSRLVPYEFPIYRGFVRNIFRRTGYDVVEFSEGVGRQYRML